MAAHGIHSFVVAACFSAIACSGAEAQPRGACGSIAAAVEQRLEATQAPSASVAVVRHGRIVFEQGFRARFKGGPPVSAATRFEIGSTTKQFTAAAILQLKREKRLSLDDKVSRFLPKFPHASELTLIQLLQQTSGLANYPTASIFIPMTQKQVGSFRNIEELAKQPLHFIPGSRWEYSNFNYIVLGRIIEVVSGEAYQSYLRRHIFGPSKMTHTAMVADEPQVTDMASGYWRGEDEKGPLTSAPAFPDAWFTAAGDVISTAGDLARWDIALQSGRIIDPGDFALMTSPVRFSDGSVGDYGFHWGTSDRHGHLELSGLGDTWGYSSANDIFPRDDLAITVLESMALNPDGSSDAAEGVALAVFNCIVPR